MFEDSTFESTGRIHTRSRGWMIATLLLNSFVLAVLILIPLIYPEALPRQLMSVLLTAPSPPPQPAPQQPRPREAFHGAPQMDSSTLTAPRQIPIGIRKFSEPEAPATGSLPGLDALAGANSVPGDVFHSQHAARVAPAAQQGPVRVSSSVVAGMLLHKTLPPYPPIAMAARMQGVVVLQATISKAGTIENLRVASGPPMLQQAALDAVREWRYRPYLLNGEPVGVETTINVIFSLDR